VFRNIAIVLFFAMIVFVVGCGEDEKPPTSPSVSKPILILEFSGLEPLANGFHYEGWVVIGDQAISSGKFNVLDDSTLVDLDGNVIADGQFDTETNLSNAIAVVISIEPNDDVDPFESETHYLGGYVGRDTAALSVDFTAALGEDFLDVQGRYGLATPTDGDSTEDEKSGLWFVEFPTEEGQEIEAGLFIPEGDNRLPFPTLRTGWVYEGWIVVDGTPVSTGRFIRATVMDSSASYSGMESGFSFPGEDFLFNAPAGLTFPIDLSGDSIAVTIEPVPDDDPGPFRLHLLTAKLRTSVVERRSYDMGNQAGEFPIGTAVIKEKTATTK